MKILASGDIHGDTRLAERLAEKAEIRLFIFKDRLSSAET